MITRECGRWLRELGAQFILDPTITPMMDGDRSILSLNVDENALREVFQN